MSQAGGSLKLPQNGPVRRVTPSLHCLQTRSRRLVQQQVHLNAAQTPDWAHQSVVDTDFT